MSTSEYLTRNGLMSEEQFKELASMHGSNCVTIYLPTYRAGEEVDQGLGQLKLKNALKSLKTKWDRLDLSKNEIKENSTPLEELLDDVHFWRNQSDGLAIFLHEGIMKIFTLPVHFSETLYLSDHFYMLPVIPFFNDNGRFFLLTLSSNNVSLYECTKHSIEEVYITDTVPRKLEDVVGYDYEDTNLQFRSGHGGDAGAMFHGQGSGKDDKSIEIEKFFRSVDSGLMKIIKDSMTPLVLACVKQYHPVFKKVSSYGNLFDDFIEGNPDQEDPLILHEKACDIVKEYFRKQRKSKTRLFRKESAGGKSKTAIEEIIPAAVDGRIDTLFIQQGKDQRGFYDPRNRTTVVQENNSILDSSLFNLAALQTLGNSGHVFLSGPDEMPVKDTWINALLRY